MTVLLIPGRERAIGAGAPVRRVLPWVHRRAVGPFVFWDHFGPEPVGEGRGLVVGEHPHIGLSTLTWMFTGEIEHRDSLGTFQVIRAGEVNWMTAGRGIAHTELGRASADGAPLEGIQLWVALPRADEQGDPSFDHRGASELPEAWVDGVAWRVVAGALGVSNGAFAGASLHPARIAVAAIKTHAARTMREAWAGAACGGARISERASATRDGCRPHRSRCRSSAPGGAA